MMRSIASAELLRQGNGLPGLADICWRLMIHGAHLHELRGKA